jgi:hypothetical protein
MLTGQGGVRYIEDGVRFLKAGHQIEQVANNMQEQ